MTTATRQSWTEDALLAIPHDGQKHELIEGELHSKSPAGFDHGIFCSLVLSALGSFVYPRNLGVILDGQTGYYMKKGDLLSPDISFVTLARVQALSGAEQKHFFRGSSDLAVEVLSPSELRTHIDFKRKSYLENNTQLVWIIDPVAMTAEVHVPNLPVQLLSRTDALSGLDLVPGFSLPLAYIFRF